MSESEVETILARLDKIEGSVSHLEGSVVKIEGSLDQLRLTVA